MLEPSRCITPGKVLEDNMGKTVPEKQTQVPFGIDGPTYLTGQEAHGRYSFEDKRRLLDVALGSCKEIQSHLYVALDLAYVDQKEFDEAYRKADVAGQLINGAINNLDHQISKRSSSKSGPRQKPR
jgi:hypothetical protein